MKIQQLLEMMGETDVPGEIHKFAIVIYHPHDRWHHLDPDDINDISVFTTEEALVKHLAVLYEEEHEEPLDISQLHDDPEIQKQLADKMAHIKKPSEMTTMDEIKQLPEWSEFTDWVTVFNRL